jgi:hypothetical protein
MAAPLPETPGAAASAPPLALAAPMAPLVEAAATLPAALPKAATVIISAPPPKAGAFFDMGDDAPSQPPRSASASRLSWSTSIESPGAAAAPRHRAASPRASSIKKS